MKKAFKTAFLFSLLGAYMASCGGSDKTAGTETTTTEEAKEEVAAPPVEEESPEASETETEASAELDLSAGKAIYESKCQACHQATGEGLPGAFPPLNSSDFLMANKDKAINALFKGLTGEITVNGTIYNSAMPPQGLSDEEARDVMNYILNSWDNKAGQVTLDEIKAAKDI